MKKLINKLLTVFCQIFILSAMALPSLSQDKKNLVIIEANVFAASLQPFDLVEVNKVRRQTFFVRVNEEFPPKFVKIRNLYSSEKEKLPEDFFKSDDIWIFYLQRDSFCDETIADWNDKGEFFLYKKYEELSPNTKVECYLLKQKPVLGENKK